MKILPGLQRIRVSDRNTLAGDAGRPGVREKRFLAVGGDAGRGPQAHTRSALACALSSSAFLSPGCQLLTPSTNIY